MLFLVLTAHKWGSGVKWDHFHTAQVEGNWKTFQKTGNLFGSGDVRISPAFLLASAGLSTGLCKSGGSSAS